MHRCDWLDGAEDTVVIVLKHYRTRLQSINDIAEETIEYDIGMSTVCDPFLSEPVIVVIVVPSSTLRRHYTTPIPL